MAPLLPVFRKQVNLALGRRRAASDLAAEHMLLLMEYHHHRSEGLTAAEAHEAMGQTRGTGVKAIEKRMAAARRAIGVRPEIAPTKTPNVLDAYITASTRGVPALLGAAA